MKFTITAGVLALALAATALVTTSPTVSATPDKTTAKQAHPLYDDGGTLDWRTKWAESAALAKERRSLVFVEWGRET